MAKVKCQNGCQQFFHETTDQFDPEATPHGGMFSLMEPFRSNGWNSFPEHVGVVGSALECPDCGAPYADSSNRVKLDGDHVPTSAPPPTAADVIPDIIAHVLALSAEGKKPGEIGAVVGLSHKKVGALIKKHGQG